MADAFSWNKLPIRIYFLTIAVDLCPVCFIIALSLTSASAAEVARPDRSEWPEYNCGSSPAADAWRLTIKATAYQIGVQAAFDVSVNGLK